MSSITNPKSASDDNAGLAVALSTTLTTLLNSNGTMPPSSLITSLSTIQKLVHNALLRESGSPSDLYRRVRLSNPKIRERIVTVDGALDILALAGFERLNLDGEDVLVLMVEDEGEQKERGRLIREELESCIAGLKRSSNNSGNRSSTATSARAKEEKEQNQQGGASEEDRKIRVRKAIAEKKARETERIAAKRRWEEDKREREEVAARRAAVAAVEAKKLSPFDGEEDGGGSGFVRIRKLGGDGGTGKATSSTDGAKKVDEAALARAEAAAKRVAALEGGSMVKGVVKTAQGEGPSKRTSANLAEPQGGSPQDREEETAMKPAADAGLTSIAKLPDMMSEVTDQKASDEAWAETLSSLPRCGPLPNIRSTSVSSTSSTPALAVASAAAKPTSCLKRLLREIRSLPSSLPTTPKSTIFVRYDEETPQFLRAVIPGPTGTPYSGGLFFFDVHIPDDYPAGPPHVTILTTGSGTVGFSPNLYADGKVCLSLLGTWEGPGWDPKHSTLCQVLISIQGLILGVEHPYFLEPGYGGWEGTVKEGTFKKTGMTLRGERVAEEIDLPPEVRRFDDQVRVGCVKFGMLEALLAGCGESPSSGTSSDAAAAATSSGPKPGITRRTTTPVRRVWMNGFEDVISAHFHHNQHDIRSEVRGWLDKCSSHARTELEVLLPKLDDALGSVSSPPRPPVSDAPQQVDGATDVDEVMAEVDSGRQQNTPKKEKDGDTKKEPDAADGAFDISSLQKRMQDAAAAGNFILAGRIQEQIQALQDGSKEDKGVLGSEEEVVQPMEWGDDGFNDGGGYEMDYDDEVPFAGAGGGNVLGGGGGGFDALAGALSEAGAAMPPPTLGGHHVGSTSFYGGAGHNWGAGVALGSTSASQMPPVSVSEKEGGKSTTVSGATQKPNN